MENNILHIAENKSLKKHLFSALFLLLFFFYFHNMSVNAQNINKHYTSSLQNKGIVYFIYPQKIGKKNKLLFDLTLFSYSDTANLNFSLFINQFKKADTLFIESENSLITLIPSRCLIETKGAFYHFRYFNQLYISDLVTLLNQKKMPPSIYVHQNEKKIYLKLRKRKWNKLAAILEKIIFLREINRNNYS